MGKDRKYIALLGSSSQLSESLANLAYKIGEEIAKCNAVIVCGGTDGIFFHAFKGARNINGNTIAIIEGKIPDRTQVMCEHVIATGMGTSRHSIIANTCDGAIIIGGWIGTLSLLINFLTQKKPVVAIKGTGGVADNVADKVLIPTSDFKVISAKTAKEAISIIFNIIESKHSGRNDAKC